MDIKIMHSRLTNNFNWGIKQLSLKSSHIGYRDQSFKINARSYKNTKF